MVPFSASGLMGRISLPASRCTRMKPTPAATNSRTYGTSRVMRQFPILSPLSTWGRGEQERSSRVGVHGQFVAPGEAGVQLVPVRHLRLAELPAQVDVAPVHAEPEVDQAGEVV